MTLYGQSMHKEKFLVNKLTFKWIEVKLYEMINFLFYLTLTNQPFSHPVRSLESHREAKGTRVPESWHLTKLKCLQLCSTFLLAQSELRDRDALLTLGRRKLHDWSAHRSEGWLTEGSALVTKCHRERNDSCGIPRQLEKCRELAKNGHSSSRDYSENRKGRH